MIDILVSHAPASVLMLKMQPDSFSLFSATVFLYRITFRRGNYEIVAMNWLCSDQFIFLPSLSVQCDIKTYNSYVMPRISASQFTESYRMVIYDRALHIVVISFKTCREKYQKVSAV